MPQARRDDLMVWIDCEMTGLDASRHVLLEIATILTTYDLEIVARGPELAIRPSPAKLRAMDSWSKRTHKKSGLLDRVALEGVPVEKAERETLRFLRQHCARGSAPLCGNSVWQDKRFIARYMPELHSFLHYRIVDVSSIKVMTRHWYPTQEPPAKRETHRALADIEESIAELKFYRTLLAGKQ